MKIVIPYRENSERCRNKNTRKFFDQKSLLEISLDHLKEHDVSLACIPTDTSISRAKQLDVGRIDLSVQTNSCSWSDLAVEIASKIDNEPTAFILCTSPNFYQFNEVNDLLSQARRFMELGSESSIVVYPFKHYVLDHNMQAVNHGQGPWHQFSQSLPQWYIMTSVMIVTTAAAMLKYRYWYDPNPAKLVAAGPCIDIDTEEDFQLARTLYRSFASPGKLDS